MNNRIVKGTIAADVDDADTFTVAYPTNPDTNVGTFYGAVGHKLVVGQQLLSSPKDFTLTFGATTITVTNKTGATIKAGLDFILQVEEPGKRVYVDNETGAHVQRMTRATPVMITLGAPITADADAIVAAAVGVADTAMTIADGDLDVPRNVTLTGVAATTAADFVVVGKDEYGTDMKETITGPVAATTTAGKKAFKKVTSITPSAATTGNVSAGFGDVLGLPVYLGSAKHVLSELQDGASATAGTFVAGKQTAGGATATDGDVRGTYDPNAACDGAKTFQLLALLPDPGYLGAPQYAG